VQKRTQCSKIFENLFNFGLLQCTINQMLDFINPHDSKLIPPGEVPSLTNRPPTQLSNRSLPPPRKNFHPKDLAVDTIIRWQADPVAFVTELFGHKLKDGEMDEWQKDFMRSLLVHDAVAVRSCMVLESRQRFPGSSSGGCCSWQNHE
jgi:hypothetical protein